MKVEAVPDRRSVSDEQALVRSQYRSKNNLEVRIRTHELYSEIDVDFAAWVLDSIGWLGNETVLDVGCGAGFYMNAVRQRTSHYLAGDLSLGMLRDLGEHDVPRINLDAQQLPLRAAAVDVILANHMLYHVADIDRALAEFRRVLSPEGRLLAATNSDQNMAELDGLQEEVAAHLNVALERRFRPNLTFTLENGADFLRRHFKHVERRRLPNALVFHDPQPVVDYLGSSFEWYEDYLPPGTGWQEVAETLRASVEQKIRQRGAFRVNKLSGVFVAWNS